jgi:hypothetical protein
MRHYALAVHFRIAYGLGARYRARQQEITLSKSESETTVAVVTTIQGETPAIKAFAHRLKQSGDRMVVIGDQKSRAGVTIEGVDYYSAQDQVGMFNSLAKILPWNNYARKNLGYLVAINSGAGIVYETDDDNFPLPNWHVRSAEVSVEVAAARDCLNVYTAFTDELIWPRGFPLEAITSETARWSGAVRESVVVAPIQQGLANSAPDVDAIWRLVFDRTVEFAQRPSILLQPLTWCPFNSQSTWWWRDAFPLLYLPSLCSMRLTDIWRGYIAQRCLWELDAGLVFHSPEVFQERNPHDYLDDLRLEWPGYSATRDVITRLSTVKLRPGCGAAMDNLISCYEQLCGLVFPQDELELVRAWIDNLTAVL